ncbi:MAG: lysophospholipid acyltransferase family protein [Rickettsiales bacterium]
MALLRSSLFNLLFYTMTAVMCTVFLPSIVMPRPAVRVCSRIWSRGTLFLARWVCGMKLELRGLENRIHGPAIYASKHQSAWETIAMLVLVPNSVFVLKKELLWLPLFGLYLWRVGNVPIDRSAGAKTIKSMVKRAKQRLDEGYNIVIFPEGTRVSVDAQDPPYLPGVAALYNQLDVPVVPVALNSGLCWGRKAVFKRPGRIIVEYMPPIASGGDRKQFMRTLKEAIEGQSQALMREVREQKEAA